MDEVKEIELEEGRGRLESGAAVFVDVRDAGSFREAHIPGALHLNDQTVETFWRKPINKKPWWFIVITAIPAWAARPI